MQTAMSSAFDSRFLMVVSTVLGQETAAGTLSENMLLDENGRVLLCYMHQELANFGLQFITWHSDTFKVCMCMGMW